MEGGGWRVEGGGWRVEDTVGLYNSPNQLHSCSHSQPNGMDPSYLLSVVVLFELISISF